MYVMSQYPGMNFDMANARSKTVPPGTRVVLSLGVYGTELNDVKFRWTWTKSGDAGWRVVSVGNASQIHTDPVVNVVTYTCTCQPYRYCDVHIPPDSYFSDGRVPTDTAALLGTTYDLQDPYVFTCTLTPA